jgi:hypothetical protein
LFLHHSFENEIDTIFASLRLISGYIEVTRLRLRVFSVFFQKGSKRLKEKKKYTSISFQKMSGEASSPCPVKKVEQFEADEALAAKMQQQFSDEAQATEMQEEVEIEDEFAAATDRVHEQQSARYLNRLGE